MLGDTAWLVVKEKVFEGFRSFLYGSCFVHSGIVMLKQLMLLMLCVMGVPLIGTKDKNNNTLNSNKIIL